jgi:hypothetical protein
VDSGRQGEHLCTEDWIHVKGMSSSHWWIPVLTGGFLFSLVDSCSQWWIPVLIGGFLFSLVDFCSHWWIPVHIDEFLFSLVDSYSPGTVKGSERWLCSSLRPRTPPAAMRPFLFE